MKGFFRLLTVAAVVALTVAACSKDENTGTVTFASQAVYIPELGGKATVGYSLNNIASVSVTGKPKGWSDPVIDPVAKTLTITAPTTLDIDGGTVVESGNIVLAGVPEGGGPVASAVVFVAVVHTVELTDMANSYLVSTRKTNYTLTPSIGAFPLLGVTSAAVLWQSNSTLIEYLTLNADGRISFYIGENSDKDKIKEGNAVIGGYDADGKLVWSWHIWATQYDPMAAPLKWNGYEIMDRNLGALANANSTTEEILNSYGLYYQWGRKDPFIGPSTYRANSGSPAAMYTDKGGRVYEKVVATSAEVGTSEYATQNPMTFITGTKESGYDWLQTADNTRWNDLKSAENDPCPAGWKVAPQGAFDGLAIVDVDGNVADKFGWVLTDGKTQSLFIGAGRRVYADGKIQNVYNPLPVRAPEAQPWVGNYWTANASTERNASSFFFWYNKAENNGGVENKVNHYRSNGMTVRCVRETWR